ncbi:hypothetical protein [Natrarchaeobius oligotrophus]|uniref:Uncharacterized protein n=1 Tax=Natrarchaeobius chitinivorans TaxID=1679083 RepID=A0A3N6N5V9_NATCH|nr:hypothetical protein [Natrarchaeobius chitinivorans]RQG93702.1 hypothetical protein EA472_22460 [Natrarchaeobius chitinivorans]
MGLLGGLVAAVIEKLPLVRLADVTGNGELELVIGPKADTTGGTVLRHLGDYSFTIRRLKIVLGVR